MYKLVALSKFTKTFLSCDRINIYSYPPIKSLIILLLSFNRFLIPNTPILCYNLTQGGDLMLAAVISNELEKVSDDAYEALWDGFKIVFSSLFRIPEVQELVIAAILNVLFIWFLKRLGLKGKHIAIITGILDLMAAFTFFTV